MCRNIPAAASLEAMDIPEGDEASAEAGTLSHGLGARPAPRPSKAAAGLKPAGIRRQRAFRHGLVRLLLQVHRKHLFSRREQQPQLQQQSSAVEDTPEAQNLVTAAAAAAVADAVEAEPRGGKSGRGSKRRKPGPARAQEPSEPLPAQPEQDAPGQPGEGQQPDGKQAAPAGEEADENLQDEFDPIAAKAWHPDFPLEAVTLEDCKAAALKLADDKALQEVLELGAPLPPKVRCLAACAARVDPATHLKHIKCVRVTCLSGASGLAMNRHTVCSAC